MNLQKKSNIIKGVTKKVTKFTDKIVAVGKVIDEKLNVEKTDFKSQKNNFDFDKSYNICSNYGTIIKNDSKVCKNCETIVKEELFNNKQTNIVLDNQEITNFSFFKSDGQYLIGTDINEGEFLFYAPNGDGYFSISDDPNENNIIINESNVMGCFVSLEKNKYVTVQDGYLISITTFKKLKYKRIKGEVVYRIGIDLPEGIYKISSRKNQMAYYCIYNCALGSISEIISNANFKGTRYVEVKNKEYLLITENVIILDYKEIENNKSKKETIYKNSYYEDDKEINNSITNVSFEKNILNIKYKPFIYLSEITKEKEKKLLEYYEKKFLHKLVNKHTIIEDVKFLPFDDKKVIMFDVKCLECNRAQRITAFEEVTCKCNEIRWKDWNIIKLLEIYSCFDDFIKDNVFKPHERYFILNNNNKISRENIFKGTYKEYLKLRTINKTDDNAICLNCGFKIANNMDSCPICGAMKYRKNDIRRELISLRLYEKENVDSYWETNITPYTVSYYNHDNHTTKCINVLSNKLYYLENNKLNRMGLFNLEYIDNEYMISNYLLYVKNEGLIRFESIYQEFNNYNTNPIILYSINNKNFNPENYLLNTQDMECLKFIYFSKNKKDKSLILNVYENDNYILKVENIKKVLQNIGQKGLLLEFNNNQKKYFDIDTYELIDTNNDGTLKSYSFEELNTNITYNFESNYLDQNTINQILAIEKNNNKKYKLVYISENLYKDNLILFKYLKDNFELKLLENEFENDKTKNFVVKIERNNIAAISFVEYILTKSKSMSARESIGYSIYNISLTHIINYIFSDYKIKEELCNLIQQNILLVEDKEKIEKIFSVIYSHFTFEDYESKIICNKLIKKYKTDKIGLLIILLYKYGEELVLSLPSIQNLEYEVSKSLYNVINHSITDKNKQLYNEVYSKLDINKIKWKSEYSLYKLVKNYFPDAIYQYRFKELGLQSLDIFIPTFNIAIEYQGQQHYEPVEIFGGIEHFQRQQQNDENKKRICKENHIILIDWKYTENINKFVLDEKLKQYQNILKGSYLFNENE